MDFDSTAPDPYTTPGTLAPAYDIDIAWVDTAGRTRTWVLLDPHGTEMAQICTKRDALKLAELLNRVMGNGHQR